MLLSERNCRIDMLSVSKSNLSEACKRKVNCISPHVPPSPLLLVSFITAFDNKVMSRTVLLCHYQPLAIKICVPVSENLS